MKWTLMVLLAAVAVLVVLGLDSLYATTLNRVNGDYFFRQLLWLEPALGAGWLAARADYRSLGRPKVAWSLGLATVGLLFLVLIPGVGTKVNGARRWLLGTQPSELAKGALVIWLAAWAVAHLGQMRQCRPGLLVPGAAIGVVCGLIFLEPDWGTAFLIAAVGGAMLAIAGTRWGYLIGAGIIALEVFIIALGQNPERLERLLAFLNPEAYRETAGWQQWNGLMALGCGGWTGTRLGGLMLGFIPEAHTDFIGAVLGQRWGLTGTGVVLAAFAVIVVCGLRIAWRARDAFGQLLAAGLTFLIGGQAFINLGVVSSSLPNKGIPLPFLSYGGSNLVAMLSCVGLLISIGRRIPKPDPPPLLGQPRPRQRRV